MNMRTNNTVQVCQKLPRRFSHQVAAHMFIAGRGKAIIGGALKLLVILASIAMVGACNGGSGCSKDESYDDCHNPESEGEWQRIEYVGKKSTTMFDDGTWGEHLYYFPVFGRTSPKDGLDTDEELTVEVNRDFEELVHFDDVSREDLDLFDNRTFSYDDLFDKDEIGTKTAGGYGWPEFYLPPDEDGNPRTGQSGVVYDPKTQDSSNNIVNQLKIKTEGLHAFCLNIVTDNTDGKYDPTVDITARADNNDADTRVPGKYLKFDGTPDVYTFKYTGFKARDRIKLRIRADKSKKSGGGLGGIMVSNIQTCCVASCGIENECGGDNGCGQPCACDKNESYASEIVPSVLSDFGNLHNEQGYYIRGLYTRQVLTQEDSSSSLVMQPRTNTANQQWVFAGSCGDSECEGYFVNKQSLECLSFDAASSKAQVGPAPCVDDKFKWILKVEGQDDVAGGEPFEGSGRASKYSIRHKPSDRYLVARATETEAVAAQAILDEHKQNPDQIDKEKLDRVAAGKLVGVEDRTNPNKPSDQWVFEYQADEEAIASE
jgi:hypothetical protein